MIEIAPGIKRKRNVGHSARKIPFETEKKIVIDYYLNNLSKRELSKKYDKTYETIQKLLKQWKGNKTLEETTTETEEQVIVVNKNNLEFLMFLLHEWQIEHRMPEKFKLTEYYQSKINQ